MVIRKKLSISESNRVLLNKLIDILHKLSNGKIVKDVAKDELSVLLSGYFLSNNSENLGLDSNQKIKLEWLLDRVYEIVDKLESGDAPLYEAIIMINKLVSGLNPDEGENEPAHECMCSDEFMKVKGDYVSGHGIVSDEFDKSGEDVEKIITKQVSSCNSCEACGEKEEVGDLISRVLTDKKRLSNSVSLLNDVLRELGFEMKQI